MHNALNGTFVHNALYGNCKSAKTNLILSSIASVITSAYYNVRKSRTVWVYIIYIYILKW